MPRRERHPSDETLLRALDRELSDDEQAALDRLRRRLQIQLPEIAAAWDRSWSFRLRRRLGGLSFAARLGGSAALVGLIVWFIAPILNTRLRQSDTMLTSALPIASLTPGAAEQVAIADICAGRAKPRSPIPVSTRQAILKQYGMEHLRDDEYELDYLITPELGGTADPKNLWPERYRAGIWNARVKDDLERLLPRLVCDGSIDLTTAQRAISENWIAAYQHYFRTERPLPAVAGAVDDDDDVPVARAGGRVAYGEPRLVALRASLTTRLEERP